MCSVLSASATRQVSTASTTPRSPAGTTARTAEPGCGAGRHR
jgi:hypothetical protein